MLERWAGIKEQKGDSAAAQRVRELIVQFGDEPLNEKRSGVSFERDLSKQSQKLARLFAKELGLSEEEYIATLPKFEPQPEQFKGRFNIPVIAETRIPLAKALKIAGIDAYFDTQEIKDWEGGDFKTPKAPYIAWLEDGRKNLNVSVEDVRKNLASDERGGTPHDGLALYLRNPRILKHHFLDFPGSRVGSGHAPYLRLWDGQPRLHRSFVGDADAGFGSVVAGKI